VVIEERLVSYIKYRLISLAISAFTGGILLYSLRFYSFYKKNTGGQRNQLGVKLTSFCDGKLPVCTHKRLECWASPNPFHLIFIF